MRLKRAMRAASRMYSPGMFPEVTQVNKFLQGVAVYFDGGFP
jgi:hypothetical protein